MDFRYCIDLSTELARVLSNRGFDANIISIIVYYTFKKRFKLYKRIEDNIKNNYGCCDNCNLPDPDVEGCDNYYAGCSTAIRMCKHCWKEKESYKFNNYYCDSCFDKIKSRKCKCKSINLTKCSKCDSFVCYQCQTLYQDDSKYCFDCILLYKAPLMSCINCKRVCLVNQYIPEPEDTRIYHPWFDEHIINCNKNHVNLDDERTKAIVRKRKSGSI